jgi:DNA polymerase-3 subunit epsilon
MILSGIDIESTGLSQEDGHRIIEIAIAMYQTTNGVDFRKLGKTWIQRINPLRAIDAKAQQVHGIELSDLKGCPEWSDVAPKINKFLSHTDILVAHNVAFDAPFVALELVRAGFPMPDFDVFCTMEQGRQATAMGKLPSLAELAWVFGRTYDTDSAHAADYDIDLTMGCFFDGLEKGFFQLPKLQALRECAA